MKAKRIILTIITLLAMASIAFAKSPYNEDDIIRHDPKAKKYTGTWLWESGKNSLMLVLKFDRIDLSISDEHPAIIDAIYGYHKFVKNGHVIENSTVFKNLKYSKTNKKSTVYGNTEENDENTLEGTIIHLSKDKIIKFTIQYINPNHIKLVKVYNTPGIKISTAEHPYDSSISLPQNIILTRQK